MRHKHLLMLLAMVLCCGNISGQSYLGDLAKLTDSHRFTLYKFNGSAVPVSGFSYKGGFVIESGRNGLVSQNDPGYAVFRLGGQYDKLSFVIGSYKSNPAADGCDCIATIKADGRRIFDEVVRDHDAPREYILDIKGVNELRFDLPRGSVDLAYGAVRVWKAGQTVPAAPNPQKIASGKVKLVAQLPSYYMRHSGYIYNINPTPIKDFWGAKTVPSVSVNRYEFNSGLKFYSGMQLDTQNGWGYFWLQKKFDKLSFIIGPCDNKSSNSQGWLTVKGDGKILYEKLLGQNDMAEQVVLDVKGVSQLSFHNEFKDGDFLGGLEFAATDIYAYPAGDKSVPQAGLANLGRERISKLPDVCKLISNIEPYSVRGVSSYENTFFTGESDHYTFSMGGERFSEGFILTTGTNFFDDNINAYAAFDLAGEYDWISFKAGCLTKHRVLDDDIIRVYADDRLVLETTIHATWPNQYFEVPVYKCRKLRFVKPGTSKSKQVYIGIGDVILYRGEPKANDLFIHRKPECPQEADLIDLCGQPYFHYVGRYLSNLNNLDFNDCFMDGSTQRRCFEMKDGRKIYKGVMLETNIPLGLENVTFADAVFMFITGAGGAISSSTLSALTGVSAGAGLAGGLSSLALMDQSGRQASVAAFNPYGEYESCTFTVANKSVYVDSFDEIFGGAKQGPPVKLNVFADQRLVGEFWLKDSMSPTTYTVPIFKCSQLMFWLECGDVRSGQYVLYDMKVSKDRCSSGIPQSYTPGRNISFTRSDTWVKSASGKVFKCVSFLDKNGNRLNIRELYAEISGRPDMAEQTAMLEELTDKSLNVGQYKTTDYVLIIWPEEGEKAPARMQKLENFKF